ncbi:MAG: hypothetical protein IPO66_00445 [Rhodanobacteraceae bacterium]|nr:hypothetical protein [Rhodanobacteraceae bacterium]
MVKIDGKLTGAILGELMASHRAAIWRPDVCKRQRLRQHHKPLAQQTCTALAVPGRACGRSGRLRDLR